jgi:hypothetical protein
LREKKEKGNNVKEKMEQAVKIETNFEYDSWGRMQKIIYPDGEEVKYEYDYGGLLRRMTGSKGGDNYTYVDDIAYNKFGAKITEKYGNGLSASYNYNPQNLRLTSQEVYRWIYGNQHIIFPTPQKSMCLQSNYTYDAKGNITAINTSNSITNAFSSNQIFTCSRQLVGCIVNIIAVLFPAPFHYHIFTFYNPIYQSLAK